MYLKRVSSFILRALYCAEGSLGSKKESGDLEADHGIPLKGRASWQDTTLLRME